MERITDKECMKMAMLNHEETFRNQVHELHRLYRVQKILMHDLKNAELMRQRMSVCSQTGLERWNVLNETSSPQPCYSYTEQIRPRRTLDLELPAEEYIREDAAREVILEVGEENNLELSLAIGSVRRKKEMSFTSDSGVSFSSSSAESSVVKLNGNEWRMEAFNVEEQLRQDRVRHPPWLIQCMSLNMT